MHEKVYLYIIIGLLLLLCIVGGRLAIQTNRLAETRQQLEHVRMELTAAQDRQYELAAILRRDSEILSESSTTVAGIRSQIRVIRESYEDMERVLYSGFFDSYSRGNSNLAE